MDAIIKSMESKIKSLNIPYATLKCHGYLKFRCMITCISLDTAEKWAEALSPLFKSLGGVACITPTLWEMKDQSSRNGESCLHIQKGFLVSISYQGGA
jgi:hypothetical protein